MRSFKLPLLLLIMLTTGSCSIAQNALLNILTKNSGIVHKGKTIFVEVTVNNTSPSSYIDSYKLRVQVSVPHDIAAVMPKGHVLPTGWTVISNDGSFITLSNGTDIIASNDARTLLISIRGEKKGGPSTILGQVFFSNGEAPGTTPGNLPGDNPADNVSTSSCKVIK